MTQTLGANGSFDAMTLSFFGEQQDKLVALLREERTVAEAKMEQQRQEAKAEAKAEAAEFRRELETQRQASEAKMEQQRQEAKAEAVEFRRELETQRQASEAATQVAVLQARLETLHGAQLLDEEVLYLAEDAIADCEDLAADDKISRLIALSTKMTSDRAFARQLQRKKWL